ncbi:type IV toxin-antitoxin system AbiEi family antitoxin [Pseudomonas aeruginosa]
MDYEPSPYEPLVAEFAKAVHEATGASLLDVHFIPEAREDEPDALGLLDTPDGKWPLLFSIKKTFYPRDVRNATWHLEGHKNRIKQPDDALLVFLAEHLSKGAREELKLRNISFFDLKGSLFLKHRNWLINIETSKSQYRSAPQVIDLFKGSREMVIHAVLQKKGEWFHGLEIVDSSETSGYSVSTVLQELERRGWVESQGQGRHRIRRLIKPGDLLDSWASDWKKRRQNKTRWYFFCPDPKQLMEKVSAKAAMRDLPCAFTGAIAANRLSPLLTLVDIAEIVVPSGMPDFAAEMGLKPAEKGSNVVLIERSGASQLFQDYSIAEGVWFVSPFIQYLDLLDGRGRNAELAAQLRNDILRI